MIGLEINLKEFSLSDMLQILGQLKKTGIIRVVGEVKGEIYIKDGIVVHATDGMEKGMEALLNLSFAELERGIFEPNIFAPEQTITEEVGRLSETIEKRRLEFNEIKEKLPPRDAILAKSTKELESAVALRRTDWQILALVDGKRTLNEIIVQSKLGGYETIKTIIWLKEQGLIYDPKEAERIMSGLANYLKNVFKIFGKHSLNWLKRWTELEPLHKDLFSALKIDEENMEIGYNHILSKEQIAQFIERFNEFISREGPQLYGKLLFKKKFEELQEGVKKGE
uniref:DUF4388 domain-containing protein n=1 Tax=candidate division WOR-3 bacterium TaxID=2052148 RepID=A0A7C4XML4_UNCW3